MLYVFLNIIVYYDLTILLYIQAGIRPSNKTTLDLLMYLVID